MIHTYRIDGLAVQTGDILCTTQGGEGGLLAKTLSLVERFAPGDVKHVIVYVGPGGRCVEAGPRGVIAFEIEGHTWAAERLCRQRGGLVGLLYGAAYPIQGVVRSARQERVIRADVARYCLAQAETGKPYNFNLLNPHTERGFYCSQLAYLAYLRHGIDLNSEQGVPPIKCIEPVVFPQEVWSGCVHRRAHPARIGVPRQECSAGMAAGLSAGSAAFPPR